MSQGPLREGTRGVLVHFMLNRGELYYALTLAIA